MQYPLPAPVLVVLRILHDASYAAHIVGGCVRDILASRTPKDWDITTNAPPSEIQRLFPDSVYENDFGTVGVKVPRFTPPSEERSDTPPRTTAVRQTEDTAMEIIEVTTYRVDEGYTNKRHPTTVRFTPMLEEDLARRDFTINAMAAAVSRFPDEMSADSTAFLPVSLTVIDPHHGQKDLQEKIVRAVGDPRERFAEDALRLLRAVRLVSELRDPRNKRPAHDWRIEQETLAALQSAASHLAAISKERIRDELSRIILSASPAHGVELLRTTGLLPFIIPELEEGVGVGQNLHHIYTVWEHNVFALERCPSPKLDVRLAALLHDVGKPRTKHGDGYHSTFYNHDHVGARMARSILTRLRYPKSVIERVALLVDNHLFYYNVGEVTESSVRRLIRRVGLENIPDLIAVRIADRLGSGVPKGKPYKLRHFEYMVKKVSHDPVSVRMLAVRGSDLMTELGLPPSPKIGALLDVLLAETIEDPTLNERAKLLNRARALSPHELEHLRSLAQDRIESERAADDAKLKKEYWVE